MDNYRLSIVNVLDCGGETDLLAMLPVRKGP